MLVSLWFHTKFPLIIYLHIINFDWHVAAGAENQYDAGIDKQIDAAIEKAQNQIAKENAQRSMLKD